MRPFRNFLLGMVCFAVLGACTSYLSEGSESFVLSSAERNALKEQLGSGQWVGCRLLSAAQVELSAPVRSLQLLYQGGVPTLVWEGSFRDSVKTVWQPLKPSGAPDGDGYVVGEADKKWVVDFNLIERANRLWTTYRFRNKGAQAYGAMVEFLDSNKKNAKLKRIRLPLLPHESVQQLWLPSSAATETSFAIVRVNRTDAQQGNEGDDASGYVLMQIHPMLGQAKRMVQRDGVYRDLDSVQFTTLGPRPEDVVAVAVQQLPPVGVSGKSRFRILAKRMFSKNQETLVLWEADHPISNLLLYDLKQEYALAWLSEPVQETYPEVFLASLGKSQLVAQGATKVPSGKAPKSGVVGLTSWRNLGQDNSSFLKPKSIKLNQFPSQLKFVSFSNSDQTIQSHDVYLTWKLQSDAGEAQQFVPLSVTLAGASMPLSSVFVVPHNLSWAIGHVSAGAWESQGAAPPRPRALGREGVLVLKEGRDVPALPSQSVAHLGAMKGGTEARIPELKAAKTTQIRFCKFELPFGRK